MFDRLIESDTSDFNPRRRYFLVSFVIVGLLFVSAVILDIYASDIGLGNSSFELSELLPPSEMAQAAPEVRPRTIESNQTQNQLPTRAVNQQDVSEEPAAVPNISTTPNKNQSRPNGDYRFTGIDSNPVGSNFGSATPNGSPAGKGFGDPTASNQREVDNDDTTSPDPPPVIVSRPKNIGVINGKASYLPKPPYPPAAISLGVQGSVTVQVTIDESGNVISAKAASGNPLLRTAAEAAAWKAKFTPTYLSKVPVKVTGVIVYNFSKN